MLRLVRGCFWYSLQPVWLCAVPRISAFRVNSASAHAISRIVHPWLPPMVSANACGRSIGQKVRHQRTVGPCAHHCSSPRPQGICRRCKRAADSFHRGVCASCVCVCAHFWCGAPPRRAPSRVRRLYVRCASRRCAFPSLQWLVQIVRPPRDAIEAIVQSYNQQHGRGDRPSSLHVPRIAATLVGGLGIGVLGGGRL